MLADLKGLHALLILSPVLVQHSHQSHELTPDSSQLLCAQSKLNDLPRLRYMGMICVCAIPVCGNAFLSNAGISSCPGVGMCCAAGWLCTACVFIALDFL